MKLELKCQNEELIKYSKGNYQKEAFVSEFKKRWEPTDLQIRMMYLASDLAINSKGVFSVSHEGFLEMFNDRFEMKTSLSSVRRFFKLLEKLDMIEIVHTKRKNYKQTSNIYIVEQCIENDQENEFEYPHEHASEHAIEQATEQVGEQQIITVNKTINNTLNNTLNLNPNHVLDIYDILWNTELPMALKNKIKVMIQLNTISISANQILLIENAYMHQIKKGFIMPKCEHNDSEALNDYEFSNTVGKMLETVRAIYNMKGMVKEWIEKGLTYKKEQLYVSDYSSFNQEGTLYYNWLEEVQ
ncbi:hypothetical protein OPHB3_2641 [Oceanobacillus picturae]|uniref:Uncharacterized protein n=1 Tax=Oceanobacillus picturae TaxID=171693 RepID=A0A0U9HIG5_9BACI|nr:hypothetical protein [Oceanobacillus picturae]GAQ18700.1 hypothetical protein OPHB3_2641 [Oceanobacillus picturae]